MVITQELTKLVAFNALGWNNMWDPYWVLDFAGCQIYSPGQRRVDVFYLDQCLLRYMFKAAFLTGLLSITHSPNG